MELVRSQCGQRSKNRLRCLTMFSVAIVLREHACNFRATLDRQIIIVNRESSVLLANQVFKSMTKS